MESENKPPEEPHPDEPREGDVDETADQLGDGATASDGEAQDAGKDEPE